ncbi:tetratricopeptide repeat protein [Collimonas fungivorans]|uniref:Flp pilus assembly protein, contains TPR repeats n=1 Tax=Collimonas fungivorans (strain Ter331) TaxID=1005048 RepID=G0AIB0_COLFT|nr:tetratricopeptide repeat protein [Collimonas fungivorans]AEK60693.1 Flp pilus assembly protein, contains TPR repeats [Collimonas fungivorans Ter331]
MKIFDMRPNTGSHKARHRAWFSLSAIALASVLAAGCASNSAKLYAQQNEAAQLRQQAEEKAPTPDNKGMYLGLIRQMQEQGMYFASLAHIDAYEQQNGSTPEVQRLRADALRETRQAAAADAAYRKLLNSTEAGAAWHGLGLLAAQSGDYRNAVTSLREAVKREPTNPVMLSDLGYAMLRSGDVASARVPLAQAAELAPDNRKMIGNLALLLLVSGDAERARAVMDKAALSADSRAAIYRLSAEIGQQQPVVVAVNGSADGTKTFSSGSAVTPVKKTNPALPPATPFQSMLDRFGNGG